MHLEISLTWKIQEEKNLLIFSLVEFGKKFFEYFSKVIVLLLKLILWEIIEQCGQTNWMISNRKNLGPLTKCVLWWGWNVSNIKRSGMSVHRRLWNFMPVQWMLFFFFWKSQTHIWESVKGLKLHLYNGTKDWNVLVV